MGKKSKLLCVAAGTAIGFKLGKWYASCEYDEPGGKFYQRTRNVNINDNEPDGFLPCESEDFTASDCLSCDQRDECFDIDVETLKNLGMSPDRLRMIADMLEYEEDESPNLS